MPNLILDFQIEGEQEMLQRLRGVSTKLKDFTPEFKKVGDLLTTKFQNNFNTQGRLLESPWEPLKASTIAEKMRKGYPTTPLIRTGDMMRSFTSHPGRFQVLIKNRTSYFAYHQSNKPRHKLPRRVMMKLTAKINQEIVKVFQSAIQQVLQARS